MIVIVFITNVTWSDYLKKDSLFPGSEAIEEVLLIHPTMEQTGSHSVAWTNLPTIAVTVKPVGNILNDLQEHFKNALFFTLESLCNITPYFTENTQVSTVFPLEEVTKYAF